MSRYCAIHIFVLVVVDTMSNFGSLDREGIKGMPEKR